MTRAGERAVGRHRVARSTSRMEQRLVGRYCGQMRLRVGSLPVFLLCGLGGVLVAVLLGMALAVHMGLSPRLVLGLGAEGIAVSVGLAALTKVLTGREILVAYQHQIAILLTAALTVHLLHRPALAYLDLAVVGLGSVIACGRIGCLLVGCCHGRPARWGVRYSEEHAREGFPEELVGVPLLPVAALESIWTGGIVATVAVMLWQGAPPGVALSTYLLAVSAGRFLLEFLRGDDRRHLWWLSQAQWTALLLTSLVLVGERLGGVPQQSWHLPAGVAVLVGSLAMMLVRLIRGAAYSGLPIGGHTLEVARATASLSRQVPGTLVLAESSFGLRLSAGVWEGTGCVTTHYTLSQTCGRLNERVARGLARLLVDLRHTGCHHELVEGREGVWHLIVRRQRETGTNPCS